MNRIEFMTELASLLQDISVEERKEAMQYYNNYFDDAGQENEEQVIEEIGSPDNVAREVKAGLKGQNAETGEFTETGYKDSRFEQKESPAAPGQKTNSYDRNYDQAEPKTNTPLKIILIVLIVLFASPVVIPLAIGILCAAFGIVIAIFVLFLALVIASISLVVGGIVLICAGIASLVPAFALGLAIIGTGLLLTVVGVIATVAATRLCTIVFPGIIRGFVWICRKPFERKVVA